MTQGQTSTVQERLRGNLPSSAAAYFVLELDETDSLYNANLPTALMW